MSPLPPDNNRDAKEINLKSLISFLELNFQPNNELTEIFNRASYALHWNQKWTLICKLVHQIGLDVEKCKVKIYWNQGEFQSVKNLQRIFSQLIDHSITIKYNKKNKYWKLYPTVNN